jgi:hypothetical protein
MTLAGEKVAVRRPASENAAMTNASAPGATVAAMVPGRHGRPFGMPDGTDIAAHGDVVGEFLASGTVPDWRWSTDGAVPVRIRLVGDTGEAINADRSKGERSMTEPDMSPRATVWPLLKAGQVGELTDQSLSDELPIVGPLLGLAEDRMVRAIVASESPA